MSVEIVHTHQSVMDELLRYVQARQPDKDKIVTPQTLLLQEGVIDSLSMMALILFLEHTFRLDFMATEIRREHFTSLNVLTDFVVNILSTSENTPPVAAGSTSFADFAQSPSNGLS